MRKSSWLVASVAAVAAVGLGGDSGCAPSKPTEVVPGAVTQVKVPEDLAAIKLLVTTGAGHVAFCNGYQVANGFVELPASLGVTGNASSGSVRVSLFGYDTDGLNNGSDWQNCQLTAVDDKNTQGAPRVLREAVLTFVNQHTLFLPMPLSFSCYDVDCSSQGSTSTCKAGACGDMTVDPTTLPDYDQSLVDGTQDCFSPATCMSPSVTVQATVVDANNCIYAAPAGTTSINVRVGYATYTQGTDPGTGTPVVNQGPAIEEEILNQDANEGFTIPDPTNHPEQFQLAPGLCTLAKQANTAPQGKSTYTVISAVEVAPSICASKTPLLPICAPEQHGNVAADGGSPALACGVPIQVDPTPSVFSVVVDDSATMRVGFPFGYLQTMNLSFSAPSFRKTYLAFDFLQHSCASAYPGSSAVGFDIAANNQAKIAHALLSPPEQNDCVDAPAALDLVNAMGGTTNASPYDSLLTFADKYPGKVGSFNAAGVMFVVNRQPVGPSDAGSPTCGGDAGSSVAQRTSGADCTATPQTDIETAVKNAAAKGLHTYFVVLDNADQAPQTGFYSKVQQDTGGTSGPVTIVNATSTDPTQVLEAFQAALTSAVTCVYDAPQGMDTAATLTYSVPPGVAGNPQSFAVPQMISPLNTACNQSTVGSTSVNGWNLVNGRIVVCGNQCASLQAVLAAAAAGALGDGGLSLDAGLPDGGIHVPDIPVEIEEPCPDAGL